MPPLGFFAQDRLLSFARPVQRLASATPGRHLVLVVDALDAPDDARNVANPPRAAAAWRWALDTLLVTADKGGMLTICRVAICDCDTFPPCVRGSRDAARAAVVAATPDAPWLLPEMRAAIMATRAVRAVEVGSRHLRAWLETTSPPPGLIVASGPRWALQLPTIMLNRMLATCAPMCVLHRDLQAPQEASQPTGRHIVILLDGSFPWSGELVGWCRDALLNTGDRVTLLHAPPRSQGSHQDERRARELERCQMLLANWSSLKGGGRCIMMRTHERAAHAPCMAWCSATVAGVLEGPAAQQGAVDILVVMRHTSGRWFMGHPACAVIAVDRQVLLQTRESPLRHW